MKSIDESEYKKLRKWYQEEIKRKDKIIEELKRENKLLLKSAINRAKNKLRDRLVRENEG